MRRTTAICTRPPSHRHLHPQHRLWTWQHNNNLNVCISLPTQDTGTGTCMARVRQGPYGVHRRRIHPQRRESRTCQCSLQRMGEQDAQDEVRQYLNHEQSSQLRCGCTLISNLVRTCVRSQRVSACSEGWRLLCMCHIRRPTAGAGPAAPPNTKHNQYICYVRQVNVCASKYTYAVPPPAQAPRHAGDGNTRVEEAGYVLSREGV